MMTMAVGCGAGNAALHTLTASGPTELRVDLRTPSDSAFARYRDFAVSGPEDNFRLHLGAYSGTAGVCGSGRSWGVLGLTLTHEGGFWGYPDRGGGNPGESRGWSLCPQ